MVLRFNRRLLPGCIAAAATLGFVAALCLALLWPQFALAQAAAALSGGESAITAAALANPYGFEALWRNGDLISKAVVAILALMSAGSWYVTVVKLIEQARLNRQARAARASFWGAESVQLGAEALDAKSTFRFIAESGIEARQKHSGLFEHVALNDWVTMSIQRAIDRVQNRLQGGLALLATVGSTAPFVGLFGTVWGIYHALTAIGVAGQASIDKVAGPVGEALIMTAIGLAVAVPAVLGYNWLVRRNKGVMDEVRAFGSDLHAVILSSAKP